MYSKLSVAAVALAIAGRMPLVAAEYQQQASGIFPSGASYQPSGSAPFPTGASGVFPTGASGVFPTGAAAGTGTGVSAGAGPEPTGDSTLTYTIGSGDHTTVVTTTIHHMNTHTHFVYASHTAAANGGSGGNGPEGNGSGNNGPSGNGAPGDVTSTEHLTSTATNYITVHGGQSGAPTGAPEATGQNGNSPAQGSGAGGCAPASTVTVQGPEVTVTVTAAPAGATNGAGNGNNSPSGNNNSPGGNNNNNSVAAGQSQASQVPPYPLPSSKKTKTKCASTGFITKPHVKPTGTGTGIIHPSPMATGSTAPIVKAKQYKN